MPPRFYTQQASNSNNLLQLLKRKTIQVYMPRTVAKQKKILVQLINAHTQSEKNGNPLK